MSLAKWIQPYEDYLELDYLATNPNPKLIGYVEENPAMIHWQYFSSNQNAINMIKQNMSMIDWKQICLNSHPDAIVLIKTHHEYYLKKWEEKRRRIPYDMMLSWENLSQNHSAIDFLKEYPENELWFIQKPPYDPYEDDYDYAGNPYFDNLSPDYQISWNYLSQNSGAMQVLAENLRNINWPWLSSNTAESAIELLREYPENIDWYWFSANPSAMTLIKQYIDHVDWRQLCKNPNAVELLAEHTIEIDWPYMCANPNAIWLLEQYRSKLDWRWLCKNPNAGPLLEENIEKEFEKFDWKWLSANPCIFE